MSSKIGEVRLAFKNQIDSDNWERYYSLISISFALRCCLGVATFVELAQQFRIYQIICFVMQYSSRLIYPCQFPVYQLYKEHLTSSFITNGLKGNTLMWVPEALQYCLCAKYGAYVFHARFGQNTLDTADG